ncbi:MAG: quinolinate synthase NadA [Syntrophomonadaceae bacterium]|nr:quinolinate synthase NadA [Syntrophomonadaceae bacterium]
MDVKEHIKKLKAERNAVILAHYYQSLEVQDVADQVGDSYALAKMAQSARQEVIVLCGVRFMAESAKILNPDKTVYLPASAAGCPMADMIEPDDVIKLREQYPDAAVVCYVNSSAAVKAVSDICCTSSSAERIVRSLPQRQVIFVPDQNLGSYVAKLVPDKEIILFPGYCPTHHRIAAADAETARNEHPNAKILAHPECREEVLEYADYIGSTAGILEQACNSKEKELIIGTEMGIVEILQRKLPDKRIYSLKSALICPNMKKTKLEHIERCLEGKADPVELTAEEMEGARLSLERMVSV